MLYQSNRMHDAVVSKLIAASRGSPCDSMASCVVYRTADVCVQERSMAKIDTTPDVVYRGPVIRVQVKLFSLFHYNSVTTNARAYI